MHSSRASLTAALALACLAGCTRHEPARSAELLPAVSVSTAVVQRASLPVELETSGTVRAVQRATIAARLSGSITTLPFVLGQSVNEGDVLLTISAVELTARVAQVRAQLSQTERELVRERTLQASGAGTVEAVRTLEDRLTQTTAALREAETMHSYATVRAPFSGVIARKFVEVGDFAGPGLPLLQLDGRTSFEIEVSVPESLAGTLAVGSAVELTLSASSTRLRTTVAELSSAADSTTRTTLAKLAVPAGAPVRAGQFVRVLLPAPSASAVLVPTSALSSFGQMVRVFVVDDQNRASLRLVKTGAVAGDRTEIVSGLAANERIVVAPPSTLRDQQPITSTP